LKDGFDWSDARLQFAVREPFPSHTTGTNLVFGEISNSNKMVVESSMPENGVIFSDGIEQDYLSFNSGCVVTIFVSKKSGALVVT
jgi:hypothetical protein